MSSQDPAPVRKEAKSSLGPVAPGERLALLDALRGFAVLAILIANYDFGQIYFDVFPASELDRLSHVLVDALCRDKFWAFFALLFGVGFGIQLERAESQGVSLLPTYLRRLAFLALIGCVLLPFIDVAVLLFLAIAGFPLLAVGCLLRRSSPKTILAAALITMAAYQAVSISDNLRRNGGLSGPPQVSSEEVASRIDAFRAASDSEAVRSTSWNLDQVGSRVLNMLRFYIALPRILIDNRGKTVLAYLQFMLVGLFLWRLDLFRGAAGRSLLFRRLLTIGLPVGLAASVLVYHVDHQWALTQVGLGAYPSQRMRVLFSPLHTMGTLGMDLVYLSGVAILMGSSISGRFSSVFAPVGRAALTNYALQALIPALIFGHYFPGIQKETLGNLLCIGLLLTVFSLQVLFSRAWLRVFRFGPLEWLWRSLTYWRLQPLRLS
ncbi:DUF418 domain-containing protein [Gemmatimonadota bacterium]